MIMQSNLTRRLISVLLVLSMLLLPIFMMSCADEGQSEQNPDQTPTDDPSTPNEPQEEETTIYTATNVPENLDLNNSEFLMLVYDTHNSVWYDVDFAATDFTSDLLNDAAYQRMVEVEEKLNVDIVAYPSPGYGFDYMNTAVSAGDDLYDAGIVAARKAATLAERGFLYDLFSENVLLDTDAPWWDPGCTSGLSVANRLYMIAGDISILYRKSVRVYYFNKQVAADHSDVPNMYELVDNGEWTLEALAECVTAVSRDLDGDDEMTGEDMYGLIYTVDTMGTGLIGAGVQIVTKDEDDIPTLTFYSDETVQAFDAFTEMLYDFDHAISGGDAHGNQSAIGSMFLSDRALFNNCELHNIASFRTMETDFGILPTPKFDEYQENYRSIINPVPAGMIVIPVTNELNLDNTCYVLDSLGAASKNTLTPAYIDTYLEGRGARDEESRSSLNIVFNNIVFDLGYIYNWGNIATFSYDLVRKQETNFTSSYEKIAASAQKALDDTLAIYDRLE
jgi:hypothetical protein